MGMPRRVLIVDDEPFIREMIGSFLSEGDTGYQVAGEAINGRLALDFLAEHPVDLVVTDIRMPVMDGIDFIREAVRRDFRCGIIVLSAYDEFHLVKEAFKLGARDYLLKSEITREELLEVFRRASADEGRRSRILSEALEGRLIPGCEDLVELGLEGADRKAADYRVLFVRIFPSGTSPGTENLDDLLRDRIKRCLRELGEEGTIFAVRRGGSAVVLLTNCPGEGLFTALEMCLREEGCEIIGGRSGPSRDPAELCELVRQASMAAGQFFSRGRGRLISWEAVADLDKEGEPREYPDKAEELRKILGLRNAAKLVEKAPEFTVHPFRPGPKEIEAVRGLFSSYHTVLRNAVSDEPEEFSGPIRVHLSEFEARIRDRGTLDEYNRWIRFVLEEYCTILNSRSRLVRKALEFVGNNYAKDLRLSEVARRLEVSESYLSRLFSREMNCGFVTYLSKVRIEKALKLLKTTELKIYEIAEKTGYPNTEHFNRTFKKLLGRSPKEYR
jgi:AraC-like DNA-binding protein/CheY-like chemotaxis protein